MARLLWIAIAALAMPAALGAEEAVTPSPINRDTAPDGGLAPVAAPTSPAPAVNPIATGPGPARPLPAELPGSPKRRRAISPEVAAQLAARTPKYTPPPPKAPEPEDDELVDLRDVDRPRNEIIRLPKYVVREPRPPVLNDRAIHTKSGLADLAMRRHLTEGYKALNSFTLPLFGSSPQAYAMMQYEEEERLRNISDLNEAARMVSASDKAAGLYVKRQVQEAFVRPGQFERR